MIDVGDQNLAYTLNKMFYCFESPQSLREGFSPGDDFPHEGHLERSGNSFDCCNQRGVVWLNLVDLMSSRPGMLLNFLQCTGQPPTTKNHLVPDVDSVKVEKP